MRYFGRVTGLRQKEALSSVVCDADLAAEELILKRLAAEFPEDGIIAEESGVTEGRSGRIWIIDPLDGTSNFVAGLPWFGVQIAVLAKNQPLAAAMYLPVSDTLYLAEKGRGAWRGSQQLGLTTERQLRNILCAFGMDGTDTGRGSRRQAELVRRISRRVRNLRATNSLVDFCYTLEGQFGGCVNLNTRIWDIAPICLMLPESGGRISDLHGASLSLDIGPKAPEHQYQILAASRRLHPALVRAAAGE